MAPTESLHDATVSFPVHYWDFTWPNHTVHFHFHLHLHVHFHFHIPIRFDSISISVSAPFSTPLTR